MNFRTESFLESSKVEVADIYRMGAVNIDLASQQFSLGLAVFQLWLIWLVLWSGAGHLAALLLGFGWLLARRKQAGHVPLIN